VGTRGVTRGIALMYWCTRENIVVVISGPSGVGKDAVIRKLKEAGRGNRHYAITATTRAKRSYEKEGVDYYFLSEEDFQAGIERAGFLEWAIVYGNYYGVPKDQLEVALSEKKDVIIKTDVQGAETIRQILPDGVFIFVAPSSDVELKERFERRGLELDDNSQLRLAMAMDELKQIPNFNYVVINEEGMLLRTVEQVEAIIEAEKCRVILRENRPVERWDSR
jgi:guanylate kinase